MPCGASPCTQKQRFMKVETLTRKALCFAEVPQSRGAKLGICPSRAESLTHRLCESQYSVHVQEQRFTEAERLTEEARRAAREAHLKAEEALSKVCTKSALPARRRWACCCRAATV